MCLGQREGFEPGTESGWGQQVRFGVRRKPHVKVAMFAVIPVARTGRTSLAHPVACAPLAHPAVLRVTFIGGIDRLAA